MSTKKVYISTYEPINKLITLIDKYTDSNMADFARKIGITKQYLHQILFLKKEVPLSVSVLIKEKICSEITLSSLTTSLNYKKRIKNERTTRF